MESLERALSTVEEFASSNELTKRIASLESRLASQRASTLDDILADERVDDPLLSAALRVKDAAGQINVIIHTVGILVSLPYILHPNEQIQSLSLGAGNTGKDFDLETDMQVAEFKFIRWRGGPEAIRQNSIFTDLFKLMENESGKRRCLYVAGRSHPLRFLNGNRSLSSVLKTKTVSARFYARHGEKYSVVSEYFNDIKDLVEIIDLSEVVPALSDY